MEKKLFTDNTTPEIMLPIPAIAVPIVPNIVIKASFRLAPPETREKTSPSPLKAVPILLPIVASLLPIVANNPPFPNITDNPSCNVFSAIPKSAIPLRIDAMPLNAIKAIAISPNA